MHDREGDFCRCVLIESALAPLNVMGANTNMFSHQIQKVYKLQSIPAEFFVVQVHSG